MIGWLALGLAAVTISVLVAERSGHAWSVGPMVLFFVFYAEIVTTAIAAKPRQPGWALAVALAGDVAVMGGLAWSTLVIDSRIRAEERRTRWVRFEKAFWAYVGAAGGDEAENM